jgi:hypothetical protein
MSSLANYYLGQLGSLLGDVELAMYKHLRSRNITYTRVNRNGITYDIKTGPSKETGQERAVFVDDKPVLRSNIHHVLAAFEALEEDEQ